ncbi:MAG: alpha/beta fold hydrolase [Gemmatimonadota bacterium]
MRTRFTTLVLAAILSTATRGTSRTLGAQPRLTLDATRTVRDSRGGDGRAFTIVSAILGETRRIDVVFPASFAASASTRRYPVMIVLDGESQTAPTAAVTDELTRNGQMPELLVVAIENTNRLRDLTPPGLSVSGSSMHEGGDVFLDFIEKELLPEIDRQFRGAPPRVLVGHSSGAILATYAAATRGTYCCIIALDAPTHLGENWLANKLTARAKAANAPLRYLSYEARFGWADDSWQALVAAAPKSWMLHHEKLPMESHESMPMLGMYLGLKKTFSDYSMLSAPVAPTTSILPYYDTINRSFGASGTEMSVIPPRKLLQDVVEDLLMEGRGAAARGAYELQRSSYGAPADANEVLSQIAETERRPAPTETVEALLATPFPTPAEARNIVGAWMGNVWMNEDELYPGKPPTVLRIVVKDGRVTGELESNPAPGVMQVQPLTYLRITPAGFTFGFMNGMRPRGVLLYEGTRTNGVLQGQVRFGGVSFVMPEGGGPIYFMFKKQ